MMLAVAFLCSVWMTAVGGYLFTFGVGRDLWTIPFDNLSKLFFLFYLEEIAYTIATGSVKVALLAFYIRLFPGQNVRRAAWAAMAFTTAFTLAFVLNAISQCTPINYMWRQWNPQYSGTFVKIWTAIMVHAVINMVLDLVIISIPMPTLYHMRMSWTNNLQVGLMFAVGLVITVVSVLRLYTLRGQDNDPNPTWNIWKPALWSAVEVDVSIICGCLPSTKLLVKQLHQWSLRHSLRHSSTPGGSQEKMIPSDPHRINKRSSITIFPTTGDIDNRSSVSPGTIGGSNTYVDSSITSQSMTRVATAV